jgi:phosphate starvation-inducible PhoH-like protein
MIQGENNLSRARGNKAQSRRQQQFLEQQQIENTIDFNQAVRKRKHIELLPKSRAQENLVVSLVDPSNYITVALGPAGTGKSYLAMLAALKDLQHGRCRKIVLTRPAVGVEDEQHGFLPGDLNQKMEPWTRPLLDIMKEFYHPREVVKMIEDGIVEISPLAFMRGRTFRDSWIVADEMQNATPNQMKMLLTRIGENSRIVVTGDIEQTDKKMIDNGLMDLADKLESHPVPGMQICRLGVRDVQRHRVIEQVLKLYN